MAEQALTPQQKFALATMQTPRSQTPKVYDDPPPTPLAMTDGARWHCRHTAVDYRPGDE